MALAGELVDIILRRVRDPQAMAHPRPLVWDLLDRAQLLLVRSEGVLIRERSFTHTVSRCFYELDQQDTLRILDIFVASSAKRLYPVKWSNLVHQLGQGWWRTAVNADPSTWAMVGSRHFVVWPAPSTTPVTLTIRDQRRPTPITADDTPLDIPDEHFPDLMTFTETVLLLRQRDTALTDALAEVEAMAQ